MQIILLEKIGGLGNLGDIVTVKNGYARNFLIPAGKAKRATEANWKPNKLKSWLMLKPVKKNWKAKPLLLLKKPVLMVVCSVLLPMLTSLKRLLRPVSKLLKQTYVCLTVL